MNLKGKKVVILAAELFEDLELFYPRLRLLEAGAEVTVVGAERTTYPGKNGLSVTADAAVADVRAGGFDGVIIPGGYSPDHMRRHEAMVRLVRQMHDDGKLVAAICHAGWMLASAGILKGRTVTSFFSIKDDLKNAGAEWVDKEVVRDRNIITSRKPDDLPAFCRTIIEALSA